MNKHIEPKFILNVMKTYPDLFSDLQPIPADVAIKPGFRVQALKLSVAALPRSWCAAMSRFRFDEHEIGRFIKPEVWSCGDGKSAENSRSKRSSLSGSAGFR